jgi:hypothetical protein
VLSSGSSPVSYADFFFKNHILPEDMTVLLNAGENADVVRVRVVGRRGRHLLVLTLTPQELPEGKLQDKVGLAMQDDLWEYHDSGEKPDALMGWEVRPKSLSQNPEPNGKFWGQLTDHPLAAFTGQLRFLQSGLPVEYSFSGRAYSVSFSRGRAGAENATALL